MVLSAMVQSCFLFFKLANPIYLFIFKYNIWLLFIYEYINLYTFLSIYNLHSISTRRLQMFQCSAEMTPGSETFLSLLIRKDGTCIFLLNKVEPCTHNQLSYCFCKSFAFTKHCLATSWAVLIAVAIFNSCICTSIGVSSQ